MGVPLFCCSVVFNAIFQAGLSPCFLDSNINDYNISVEDLRKKRADLAAVVAVHMFGNPCDMDAIIAVADTIPVIEDCAQSFLVPIKENKQDYCLRLLFFRFDVANIFPLVKAVLFSAGNWNFKRKSNGS